MGVDTHSSGTHRGSPVGCAACAGPCLAGTVRVCQLADDHLLEPEVLAVVIAREDLTPADYADLTAAVSRNTGRPWRTWPQDEALLGQMSALLLSASDAGRVPERVAESFIAGTVLEDGWNGYWTHSFEGHPDHLPRAISRALRCAPPLATAAAEDARYLHVYRRSSMYPDLFDATIEEGLLGRGVPVVIAKAVAASHGRILQVQGDVVVTTDPRGRGSSRVPADADLEILRALSVASRELAGVMAPTWHGSVAELAGTVTDLVARQDATRRARRPAGRAVAAGRRP